MTRLIVLAFAFLAVLFASVDAAETKPNIVVILCDDLGYGDLGCYGHPHIKTPHLNRMAEQGIRLTACYSAAPVCSPSRVGLLTGRSPNRAGVYDWIPATKDASKGRGRVHMRATEVTIPALLKKAGYATCLTGKWHCNAAFNSSAQPQPGDFGFDHWFATQNNAAPSHENPINFVRNGKAVGPREGYSCQIVVDEAINWLCTHLDENPDQPFFMFIPFHEPHEPIASPPKLVAGYEEVAKEKAQAEYFANVENMDRAVGQILEALTRLRKDENTLVIFTSDNGPETLRRYRGASRSWGTPDPLRGMKLWTTEAGFRVAGIMRWPKMIKQPTEVHHPVSSLDFLPSFCEVADVEPPKELKLDGANFLPVFQGKPIEREKPLFWCYYNAINERRVAMRDGPWKILAKLNSGQLPKVSNIDGQNIETVRTAELTDFQLFHLPEDIAEASDVKEAHPDVFQKMKDQLQSAYAEMVQTAHYWE